SQANDSNQYRQSQARNIRTKLRTDRATDPPRYLWGLPPDLSTMIAVPGTPTRGTKACGAFPKPDHRNEPPVAGAFALIDYAGALRLRHAPTQAHERADHQHAQAEHAECAGFRSVDGVTDNQRKTLLCAGVPRPRVGCPC